MTTPALDDVAQIAKITVVEKILEVVCRTTGLGFAAVARVTESQWLACAVVDKIQFGLKPGDELPLKTTICDEIRDSGHVVAIDNVAEDKHYCDHATPKLYGFQSYISVPIHRSDGRFFGTLCAIGKGPALVNNRDTIEALELFADLVAMHLDAHDHLTASEHALQHAHETATLRDQFIAVLGHDLRNPLGAISSGAEVIRTSLPGSDPTPMLDLIQRSTLRMSGLINNVLDFARGRLAGGLPLGRIADAALQSALEQVVKELQTVWPGHTIHSEFAMTGQVFCDSARIAQLFSNLLANALSHGDAASPVWVEARVEAGEFTLSVTNHGKTIPPEIRGKLFQPFSRETAHAGQQGLGLGLYISAEIARAHQGTLELTSQEGETRFTFRMPCSGTTETE